MGAPPDSTTRGTVDKQYTRDHTPTNQRAMRDSPRTDHNNKQDGGHSSWPTTTHVEKPIGNNDHAQPAPAINTEGKGSDGSIRVSKHFDDIRRCCEGKDRLGRSVDTRPQAVAGHRRTQWPNMQPLQGWDHLVKIYDVVRATGLPNAMSARVPVPSSLNTGAWEYYLGMLGDRENVLDFVQYGFPTGYVCPVSNTTDTPNHPSATDFPSHIQEFIDKEMELKGVAGPYPGPPFTPWCHVSPLMSREKGATGKRRIITDMTFPSESSINAYIVKNGVYGVENHHSLPTVDTLAHIMREMGPGVHLSTVDVSRAYKNFVSDPLDWPLLCFAWDGSYYCDLSMPFGARASSFHMQSVANCITDILKMYGITSLMYLDDLIIVSPDRESAWLQYNTARRLLHDLGLPEAKDKAQTPNTSVRWLGIVVDAANRTLSIPGEKVHNILEQVSMYTHKSHITKKQLQSMLGQLLFVAKCVRPARVFVSRLLESLRQATNTSIKVTEDMRADLAWFIQFCGEWNGVGIIAPAAPDRVIMVDACLSGLGGTDGQYAYGLQVAPVQDGAANITELEAANVVVALHTLLGEKDRGSHILVRCDNFATVQALRSGRAKNHILQECARAAWMVQALLGVDVSYDHIPGVQNDVADALSRAHLNLKYKQAADSFIDHYFLSPVFPCTYFLYNMDALLVSRSGHGIAPPQGRGPTRDSTGTRHQGQPHLGGGHIHSLHGPLQPRPSDTISGGGVRLPGVYGGAHTGPRNNKEQGLAYQDVPAPHGGLHGCHLTPKSAHGPGGIRQGQDVSDQEEEPTPGSFIHEGSEGPPRHRRGSGGQGSSPHHILRRASTIRDRPHDDELLQPVPPPYQGRLRANADPWFPPHQVGQEHAKGVRIKTRALANHSRLHHVPNTSPAGEHGRGTDFYPVRPVADVPRYRQTRSSFTHKENMERSTPACWRGHNKFISPQPQENGCVSSPPQGLFRGGNPTPRGVEVGRVQNLYRHPNWSRHSCAGGLCA